jgi:hypothetical protein
MTEKINFFNNIFDGEMLPYERYKLYNWISEIRPTLVLEVGTGNGGGSTYFISKSIKDNNLNSTVHTCDPVRKPDNEFFNVFDFVKFYKTNSDVMINDLLKNNLIPDFIMFDGPEDPDVALNDIIVLENFIGDGTYFCMHDWDHYRPYDKAHSTKSIKIKDYIENSEKWSLVEQLFADKKNSDFDDLPYDSVGLCLYKFNK